MPLRIYKRKDSPNWYIRGTVRGIAVEESAKTTEREAAEEIRIKREAELLERSIHGARATATFLQAAEMYIDAEGERTYLRPLIDHFGSTPLARIDQAAIDQAAALLKPKASPATRNRQIYTPMAAILHYAAKRGLCEFLQVDRPRQPRGRARWLQPAEAERLIEACSDHLRPLVIFLFGTGARLSEALYLQWTEVNLADRRVAFLDTKNGEARGVPLNERVWLELIKLEHRDGAVFRRPDGQPYVLRIGGGGQISTAFYGACRRAGIADFSPHDCRHTWATWFYSSTRDIRALMELGGWKSERMVMRYTHINPDHLADAINRLPWEETVKSETAEPKNS